jgi:hypothetical protein
VLFLATNRRIEGGGDLKSSVFCSLRNRGSTGAETVLSKCFLVFELRTVRHQVADCPPFIFRQDSEPIQQVRVSKF